ncbi:hypothetical protein SDC9_100306 [bioreactor metagenome]|uniref:Uncharacterized protein n=1 Tax=bioreactor metagenome TaxID=1076179 RepID=A0A645ALC3_9ZZZZ
MACLIHIIDELFPFFFANLIAGKLSECLNKLISINNRPFTALHLPLRKVHHSVREVVQIFCPAVAKQVQNVEEHPEVVLLLAGDHVDE